ncbi:MAG: HypC/HybG/HupF family hydrogenase formation chaperone [Bifidobacteriaceae bacterium]|nr:HypC/HybG/HupF family hydrogenase formation chaperone [Bifidobacteriaceae bacterium]
MTLAPDPSRRHDEVCITCSDQAIVAEVLQPPATAWEEALVQTADGTEAVDVSLVGPVQVGDLVLIHAGTAIGRASERGPA